MNVADLRLTHQAKSDLLEIWVAVAHENVAAADKITGSLELRMGQLRHFPELGVSRDDIRPGFRLLVEGRYLIIYDWIEVENMIEIVSVIHSVRDLRKLF